MLICISVFGTSNANVLSPPRLTFAMGQHGHFLRAAGRIHPRFHTPGNAILIHLVVMILLVFTGSFYMLADMYIFIVWFFNLFLIAGLFLLRRKMPDAHRPYRVWGYPWMPILIFVGNSIYLGLILYGDAKAFMDGKLAVMNSLAGLALTAIGIPLYFIFKKQKAIG
jgi:APA family basic amino acid/polyamine antiporter